MEASSEKIEDYIYGVFREDIEQLEGHSKELVYVFPVFIDKYL